jgi:hypothetical protein
MRGRLEYLMNVLTILVLTLSLVIAGSTLRRPTGVRQSVEFTAIGALRNYQLDSVLATRPRLLLASGRASDNAPLQSTTRLKGSAHVIYFFRTTCPACESQHVHMGDLLAALPDSAVITGSAEPLAATAGYWRSVNAALPPPVQFQEDFFRLPGIDATPIILFVDKDGRVQKAIRGTMRSWSGEKFTKAFHDLVGQ